MSEDPRRKTFKWLFALYCVMMLWLLLFRRIGSDLGTGRYNLQPLDTVGRYLWVLRHSSDFAQRSYAMANLLGNIWLFLPMGVFLPVLFAKLRKFGFFLLWSVLIIVMVELLQLVTGLGALDVDDLLLNLAGTVLGWLSWKLFQKGTIK